VNHVLVIDDEPAIRDAVGYSLRAEGFDVDMYEDGEAGLAAALEDRYDVVVLDLMLPGLSGSDVCRRLRAESAVPIIMLTARGGELDRVLGLEIGADDYVTKPFSMAELIARVRALLRRRALDRAEQAGEVRRIGGVEIDFPRHEVHVDGRTVELTPSEFRLLALLSSEPGRAFDRRDLVRHLWKSDFAGDERACDTHMVNLRRKVERDPRRPERIVTVRGVGYKLVPV
jgi:two-component system response regulator RegX3